MKRCYLIGKTVIELSLPQDMLLPQTLSAFACVPTEPAQRYRLYFSDHLSDAEQQFRAAHADAVEFSRTNLRVLTADGMECRLMFFEGNEAPYAVSQETEPGVHEVCFAPAVAPMLSIETIFLSALRLEQAMLADGGLILHAAYIRHQEAAVLFTAPSGTGKSTQAGLWEKHRGAETINGDRTLLLHTDSGWHACGWPVCGSSAICRNESYPIRAIVFLRQATDNSVRRLGLSEAVKKLFTQITVNMWNSDFQMRVMDHLLQLTAEVPVFELACNISEEAVTCLEAVL